jgi:hypothetical protein
MDLMSEVDTGKVPDEKMGQTIRPETRARGKTVPCGHDGARVAAQINGGLSSLKKGPSGMLSRSYCMRDRLKHGAKSRREWSF